MKKIMIVLFSFLLTGTGTFSQISINSDGTSPDPSAVLDLKSTSKGLLIPRLTTAQQNAISSPAEGLMIYNTDYKTLSIFIGTSWRQLIPAIMPWNCGQPFADSRDGKIYTTVLIGSQCWMAQNLNTGTRINAGVTQANNSTIEKYCYSDLESNCDIYGGLYQWDEVMNYTASSNSNPSGRQGICPSGWHLPSDLEWCQMAIYLDPTVDCSQTIWIGTDVGGKLKEAGLTHWISPNTGATNSSGFTSLPADCWDPTYHFRFLHYAAYFWVSTESSTAGNAWLRYHGYWNSKESRIDNPKLYGYSCRCVHD